MTKPLFVFMDESGRKESDPHFVCGFLEIEDNQAFCSSNEFELKHYLISKENQVLYCDLIFEPGFNWNVKSGKLPMAILPLDSKACLQLQASDVLSGLIAQALKLKSGKKPNNKDLARQPVLDVLEREIGKKIEGNLTVHKPNYFNVWMINWSKSKKRPGHGQETQPRS